MTIADSVSIHLAPQFSAPNPLLATAAPAKPPINACDELDGMPNHQVIRFQMIAPSSAAAITLAEMADGSTYPELMALATAVPTVNSAAKLKVAAQSTALNGVRTRVPTIVAMELAES